MAQELNIFSNGGWVHDDWFFVIRVVIPRKSDGSKPLDTISHNYSRRNPNGVLSTIRRQFYWHPFTSLIVKSLLQLENGFTGITKSSTSTGSNPDRKSCWLSKWNLVIHWTFLTTSSNKIDLFHCHITGKKQSW